MPPCSTFEYGGALTEMVLLGVLAIRMKDQRLEWDSQNLRFTNNETANELLRIQYREGWTLCSERPATPPPRIAGDHCRRIC